MVNSFVKKFKTALSRDVSEHHAVTKSENQQATHIFWIPDYVSLNPWHRRFKDEHVVNFACGVTH